MTSRTAVSMFARLEVYAELCTQVWLQRTEHGTTAQGKKHSAHTSCAQNSQRGERPSGGEGLQCQDGQQYTPTTIRVASTTPCIISDGM